MEISTHNLPDRANPIRIVDRFTGEIIWRDGQVLDTEVSHRLLKYRDWLVRNDFEFDACTIEEAMRRANGLFNVLYRNRFEPDRERFLVRDFVLVIRKMKTMLGEPTAIAEILPHTLGAYAVAQALIESEHLYSDPFAAAMETGAELQIPCLHLPPGLVVYVTRENCSSKLITSGCFYLAGTLRNAEQSLQSYLMRRIRGEQYV